jgi:hypothetical protein
MRTSTHTYLARLPARKLVTVVMLFAVVCGGVLAGSVLS